MRTGQQQAIVPMQKMAWKCSFPAFSHNEFSFKSILLKLGILFWNTGQWCSSWTRESLVYIGKKERKKDRKTEYYLCFQQTATNPECLQNVSPCQHCVRWTLHNCSSTVQVPKCRLTCRQVSDIATHVAVAAKIGSYTQEDDLTARKSLQKYH